MKNRQSPIARQAEVIFRTLLFTFLCLEICAIAFLISKLLLIPLYKRIGTCLARKYGKKVEPTVSAVHDDT